MKKAQGGDRKSEESKAQIDPLISTAAKLAKEPSQPRLAMITLPKREKLTTGEYGARMSTPRTSELLKQSQVFCARSLGRFLCIKFSAEID
jgi:hypothetical protein